MFAHSRTIQLSMAAANDAKTFLPHLPHDFRVVRLHSGLEVMPVVAEVSYHFLEAPLVLLKDVKG
jgi:hypothetical protein